MTYVEVLLGFVVQRLVGRLQPLVDDAVGALAVEPDDALAADYHRHALSHVVKVKNAQQLILLLFSHFLQTKIGSQYKAKKVQGVISYLRPVSLNYRAVDYRCEGGPLVVSASCLTISNPNSLGSIAKGVNPGIRSLKKHLSD